MERRIGHSVGIGRISLVPTFYFGLTTSMVVNVQCANIICKCYRYIFNTLKAMTFLKVNTFCLTISE